MLHIQRPPQTFFFSLALKHHHGSLKNVTMAFSLDGRGICVHRASQEFGEPAKCAATSHASRLHLLLSILLIIIACKMTATFKRSARYAKPSPVTASAHLPQALAMRIVGSHFAAAVEERSDAVALLIEAPRPGHRQKRGGRHLCSDGQGMEAQLAVHESHSGVDMDSCFASLSSIAVS